MSTLSIPPLVMACTQVYIGILNLGIYMRRKEKNENLYFALFCFGNGLYAFFCAGLYSVNSVDEAVFWQRLQYFTIQIAATIQMWFIVEFTTQKVRIPKLILTGFYFLLTFTALFLGDRFIFNTEPLIREITIFLYSFKYIEMNLGRAWDIQFVLAFFLYFLSFWCIIKSIVVDKRKRSIPMLFALIIHMATVVNDILVGSGIYNSIYLIEYSFFFFVAVMTFVLQNDVVKAANIKKKLEKSEETLRKVIEFSPDAIVITDVENNIITINKKFVENFGYTIDEMKTAYDWVEHAYPDESFRTEVKAKWDEALLDYQKTNSFDPFEALVTCKDGSQKYILFNVAHFDDKFIISFVDLSEQKKASEMQEKLIEQKQALIMELYHRTKNNMQLISSLLNLKANASENKELIACAADINHKINSMSLVQTHLYRFEDLSKVNIKKYVEDLINYLCKSFDVSEDKIKILQSVDDFSLSVDCAMPLAIVLSEIISNSILHAFPEDKNGHIELKIYRSNDDRINVEYSDNGIGFETNDGLISDKSMGMKLVNIIVVNQFKGELKIDSENGISIIFSFNDKILRKSIE